MERGGYDPNIACFSNETDNSLSPSTFHNPPPEVQSLQTPMIVAAVATNLNLDDGGDFEAFLANARIGHLKETFAKEGINDTDTALLITNENDWKLLGVERIGDRKRLMDALRKVQRERCQADYV